GHELGEPAARVRFAPVSQPADVVAADHTDSTERRRPSAGRGGMTDIRAAMRRAVSDAGEPGAAELYLTLAEALLDSAAAEEEGPADLARVIARVDPLSL